MTAYPGEKALDDIYPQAGTPGWGDYWDAFEPDNDGSYTVTMSAGDDVIIYATTYWYDPDRGDTIAGAWWILEVDSGGGTFEVTVGWDYDWNYDPDLMTWESAQTVTLDAGRHAFALPAYQLDYSHLSWDGSPVLRIKAVSGSSTFSGGYLQVQGPDGLLVPTGVTEWSDWKTTSLVNKTPYAYLHGVRRSGTASSGGHGSEHDSAAYEAVVNAAYDAALAAAPTITDEEGMYPIVGQFSFNVHCFFGGGAPPYTYTAFCDMFYGTWTYSWTTGVPTYKPPPPDLLGLANGRDYVSWQYDPTQDSVAEEWEEAYLIPVVNYYNELEGGLPNSGIIPSPAGDSYTISPFGTLYGSQSPLNQRQVSEMPPYYPPPETLTYTRYQPPDGDFTISATSNWLGRLELVPPDGGWDGYWTYRDSIDGNAHYYWNRILSLESHQTPYLRVRPPNHRLLVPLFELSGDTIAVEEVFPAVPPGYYLDGTMNLAGLGDGVDVNFVSS